MKMTKLEKKIATIILMVVMVAIVGIALQFFIYKPNTEQIDTLTNEIESLADKVEEAKKAPSLIVAYQNKINALIGGSEENSNLLNQVIDVPDTLRLIENAAASSGVEFEEISMNGNASFVKGGLSGALNAVISQKLVQCSDRNSRVPVNEIMLINDAIANNIREGKTAAINNAIATGAKTGMISFELSLYNLVKRGVITKEKAFEVANDKGTLTSLFEK